jgi:hypothetical protein
MKKVTFNDLSKAAGMLNRAAHYLLESRGPWAPDISTCEAMGTLMGLAYKVRPVKNVLA